MKKEEISDDPNSMFPVFVPSKSGLKTHYVTGEGRSRIENLAHLYKMQPPDSVESNTEGTSRDEYSESDVHNTDHERRSHRTDKAHGRHLSWSQETIDDSFNRRSGKESDSSRQAIYVDRKSGSIKDGTKQKTVASPWPYIKIQKKKKKSKGETSTISSNEKRKEDIDKDLESQKKINVQFRKLHQPIEYELC